VVEGGGGGGQKKFPNKLILVEGCSGWCTGGHRQEVPLGSSFRASCA
jgi:hypothetical protein